MSRASIVLGLSLIALGACKHASPEAAIAPAPQAVAATTNPSDVCDEVGSAWAVVEGERTVATTRGRCLGRDDDGWHFVSQLQWDAQRPTYEMHLWLDDEAHPKLAELRTPTEVTHYRWLDDRVTISRHGDVEQVSSTEHTPPTDLWVVPAHAVYLRELMMRVAPHAIAAGRHTESRTSRASGTLATGGTASRPGASAAGGTANRSGTGGPSVITQLALLPSQPPRVVPLRFELETHGDHLLARAEQGTFAFMRTGEASTSLRLERATTPSGLDVYRAVEPSPWQPSLPDIPTPVYALPSDLAIEPVTFAGAHELVHASDRTVDSGESGKPGASSDSGASAAGASVASQGAHNVVLHGELVRAAIDPALANIPRQRKLAKRHARKPAALILGDAGPQDRYGFVPGTSIDTGMHAFQDALARAGFVVLRYDERGVAASDGHAHVDFVTGVADARAALTWLMQRDDIDPTRVVLMGHGEGALTASILATERLGKKRSRPAAIVMLAAYGRPIRDVIEWQSTHQPATSDALANLRALHDAIAAGQPVDALDPVQQRRLAQLFAERPLDRARAIKAPLLVVSAAKDFQTAIDLDHQPLANLALAQSKRGSAAHIFDKLDHLFKPEPALSTIGHYGDLSRHVAPHVITYVVDWTTTSVGLR